MRILGLRQTVYFFLVASLFTLVTLQSCTTAPIDENDPAALFKDAEDDVKADHFLVALDKLRSIRNKFPYSSLAVEAQLKIADVYFLQEAFPEAAASYEAFKELHPRHPKAAYASFRAAKSYYSDSPTN